MSTQGQLDSEQNSKTSSNEIQRKKFHQISWTAKIINSLIAGFIGVTCTFPLDLVKTRLQNQKTGPYGEKMYTSIIDCLWKIYRTEGLKGMYANSPISVLLVGPEKSLKLLSNDFFRHCFRNPEGKLTIGNQILAGMHATIVQVGLTTPVELIKIQIQEAGRVEFFGDEPSERKTPRLKTIEVVKRTLRENYFRGLYKGLAPTAIRDIFFNLYYFPLFAIMNDLGPRRKDQSGEAIAWWSLLTGLVVASSYAVVATPIDVIKTRTQLQKQCMGMIDCINTTYRHEGFHAFFKGGLCRVMVIGPLFGIAHMVFYLGIAEVFLSRF